jgi:hypothetical protein
VEGAGGVARDVDEGNDVFGDGGDAAGVAEGELGLFGNIWNMILVRRYRDGGREGEMEDGPSFLNVVPSLNPFSGLPA